VASELAGLEDLCCEGQPQQESREPAGVLRRDREKAAGVVDWINGAAAGGTYAAARRAEAWTRTRAVVARCPSLWRHDASQTQGIPDQIGPPVPIWS
jgi:hypothetical protein